jgi:DNA ligase (NAD+)
MVGSRTAELLAEAFPDTTLYKLWTAKIEHLLLIAEIGPKVAGAIKYFVLQYPSLPKELAEMNVAPQILHSTQNNYLPLTDYIIAISGTLLTMSRNEAETHLQNMGAKVVKTLSNKTTVLVAGEKAGTKLNKAKALGIPIRDENWILSQKPSKN